MRAVGVMLLLFAGLVVLADEPPANKPLDAPAVEFFEKRIRPLLIERCFACHGDDQAESELRLDSPAALQRGGATGEKLFTPEQPERSYLLKAVRQSGDLKMVGNARKISRSTCGLHFRNGISLETWDLKSGRWSQEPKRWST